MKPWIGLAVLAAIAAMATPTGLAVMEWVSPKPPVDVIQETGGIILFTTWLMIMGIMGIGANWVFEPMLRR